MVNHAVLAFDLADLRVPSNTELSWVGRGIEHNGVKMDIQLIKSTNSSEQILSFYKDMWESEGGQGEGYTINQAGDFRVISKIEDNHNVVIQVRDNNNGQAVGYLSAIDLTSLGNVNVEDNFPVLSNTTLVSKTTADEYGKSSVTRIYLNDYSISANVDFYKSRLESEGWKKSFADVNNKNYLAYYSKNNKTLELAISKKIGTDTVIFVNIVDES